MWVDFPSNPFKCSLMFQLTAWLLFVFSIVFQLLKLVRICAESCVLFGLLWAHVSLIGGINPISFNLFLPQDQPSDVLIGVSLSKSLKRRFVLFLCKVQEIILHKRFLEMYMRRRTQTFQYRYVYEYSLKLFSWRRALDEELLFAQLVNKLISLWNPKFHFRVYKSSQRVLVLSLIKPSPFSQSDLLSLIWYCLQFTPRCSKWYLSLRVSDKNFVRISHLANYWYY
jgi:hypothetical protein